MKYHHKDISICLFLILTAGIIFLISSEVQSWASFKSNWVHRLIVNLLGYGGIFIPGYIIIKYLRRDKYNEKPYKGFLWPLIKECVYGQEGELLPSSDQEKAERLAQVQSFSENSILLIYCFAGLQGSYLIWGLLQEKIMTQKYSGDILFSDSQFLVFINRLLALVIALIYLRSQSNEGGAKSRGDSPLYKYSYCAFSNVMSSWFQYEALKFVSFPTQVLAKACKIIPVMLMGKLISRQTYEFYEYFTAILISFGMVLFLSGSSDYLQVGRESDTVAGSWISGFLILALYMVFDSFTSNWQSELFRSYKMSSVQMMAGVNIFSCLLTFVSLFQQGEFIASTKFMFNNNEFAWDCLILSFCSAIGQLFIYFTIEKFGAVIFITIMTIRQALAVLLSCIFYNHPINGIGVIGVIFVFLSIFIRIYCSYRISKLKSKKLQPNVSSSQIA